MPPIYLDRFIRSQHMSYKAQQHLQCKQLASKSEAATERGINNLYFISASAAVIGFPGSILVFSTYVL